MSSGKSSPERSAAAAGRSRDAEIAEDAVDEERHVAGALAQGRQRRHEHGEAEVEVGAEAARVDLGLEVAVGGGDDAHVDGQAARRADALHLAALEHAQELRLQLEGELADLVEEDGAAGGGFEGARAPRGRRR